MCWILLGCGMDGEWMGDGWGWEYGCFLDFSSDKVYIDLYTRYLYSGS